MTTTFVTSDTHFGHSNICKFLNADGTKVRPWDTSEEMDEVLVANWNNIVGPNDKVYHLGDVTINRRHLHILYRLNGDKVLIKGNHDIFKLTDYAPHFRDIRACHVLYNLIMTHIPIHEQELKRFKLNLHGNLHGNLVRDKWGNPDPRYKNVCVEHTNYTPIPFDDLIKNLGDRPK
jgi:calcineurin-like phosphoesterase family protein